MHATKRALITGITGFTGHYVATELAAAGFEVHGIGEHPSLLPRYTCVNLSDRVLLHSVLADINPQVVVHLAGKAFVGSDNTRAFYQVNTTGTRNLLEAIAYEVPRVKCILLASSANVYGNSIEETLSETVLPKPANDYALSKLAMEQVARLWFDRLPIVITRPFNYTGVGQSEIFLLPKVVGHFKRRLKKLELGNLDIFRDFSDVRSVAKAYSQLIKACPVGETINICSGNIHSLSDVVKMVAKITGHNVEIVTNPAFVRPNEIRKLQGCAERLRNIIDDWYTLPLCETLEWMCHSPDL